MDSNNQYPDYVEKTIELNVSKGQEPIRLDVYITNAIANATRNKVQLAIDNEQVHVDGIARKGSYKVKPGDVITCVFMRPPPLELLPEDIPLSILYEDEYLLVINKPAGLVVHPGFGNRYGTLVNAVLWHIGHREAIPLLGYSEEEDESEISLPVDDFIDAVNISDDILRPGIVHRLDKDTSGLMVISKQSSITPQLTKQFADRTVQREYVALAWGIVKKDHDIIENQLAPSPRNRKIFSVVNKGGKIAKTEYVTRSRGHFASLLQVKLHTGRTHQIRVHCSSIHHPLIGDVSYGGNAIAYTGIKSTALKRKAQECLEIMKRQALHARILGFQHPITQEHLLFEQPPPVDFTQVAELAEIRIPDDLLVFYPQTK
ncbi:MAG: RluA family pseudouridine synthase [Ignavibacteria bacterium]